MTITTTITTTTPQPPFHNYHTTTTTTTPTTPQQLSQPPQPPLDNHRPTTTNHAKTSVEAPTALQHVHIGTPWPVESPRPHGARLWIRTRTLGQGTARGRCMQGDKVRRLSEASAGSMGGETDSHRLARHKYALPPTRGSGMDGLHDERAGRVVGTETSGRGCLTQQRASLKGVCVGVGGAP